MNATKNANFPFITIKSAILKNFGEIKQVGLGVAILDNSVEALIAVDCKDLIYHIDAHTAKTYNKHLIDTI